MSNIPLDDPAEIHAPAPKDEEPVNALVMSQNAAPAGFGSRDAFTLLQQQAKLMASSELVPTPYKGSIANCAIALEIAFRVGCSPLMVAQNLDIIKGRPSWRAQYVIGAINSHPKFKSGLEFVYSGAPDTDARSCYATAVTVEGRTVVGPTVSLKMAKAEGWWSRDGSKWKTLLDLMLAYRCGAFFGRLYVPEILMGMLTTEEVQDMGDRISRAKAIEARFNPPQACTHDAGPIEQKTPSPYPDEPPYIEEVCGGCQKPWKEIEQERGEA